MEYAARSLSPCEVATELTEALRKAMDESISQLRKARLSADGTLHAPHGIPICPNTDDPGIMGIDLNHEWQLWRHTLGFSENDMSAMTLLALEKSFLPFDARERLHNLYFSGLAKQDKGENNTVAFEASIAWANAHHQSQIV